MIQTIIVDDEPLAREGIRLRLETEPDIDIVGEYGTGREAVQAIEKLQPDLIFLDVQMPAMSGFEVLAQVSNHSMPLVLFVTAYDRHALQAFEVHALDYLLKPIDNKRFRTALERVRQQLRQRDLCAVGERVHTLLHDMGMQPQVAETSSESLNTDVLERLVIKSHGRVFFLRVDEIDWIEAAGDYVCLHADGSTHLLRETMAQMEKQLDSRSFQRIHRSTIVNLDRVRELRAYHHGEYMVYLKDGTELKLSRTYRDKLQTALGTSL